MKNPRNNKMKASPPAKTIKLASANSAIVPFMKTHVKNPHKHGEQPIRTKTYLHPNERKRRFGTFDKI